MSGHQNKREMTIWRLVSASCAQPFLNGIIISGLYLSAFFIPLEQAPVTMVLP